MTYRLPLVRPRTARRARRYGLLAAIALGLVVAACGEANDRPAAERPASRTAATATAAPGRATAAATIDLAAHGIPATLSAPGHAVHPLGKGWVAVSRDGGPGLEIMDRDAWPGSPSELAYEARKAALAATAGFIRFAVDERDDAGWVLLAAFDDGGPRYEVAGARAGRLTCQTKLVVRELDAALALVDACRSLALR